MLYIASDHIACCVMQLHLYIILRGMTYYIGYAKTDIYVNKHWKSYC